jgi:hypothetical protein
VKYFATVLTLASKSIYLQSPQTAQQTAVSIIQEIVCQLEKGDEPGRQSKFFRNGIELIDISVQVGTVKIEVKVAGPKPPTA